MPSPKIKYYRLLTYKFLEHQWYVAKVPEGENIIDKRMTFRNFSYNGAMNSIDWRKFILD